MWKISKRKYTYTDIFWEKYESNYSPSSYGQIVGQTGIFDLGEATSLGEGKLWI